MKQRKHGCRGLGLVLAALVVLTVGMGGVILAVLMGGPAASQETAESDPAANQSALQQTQSVYLPAYLDKSESLYRYHDPELGITGMAGIDVSGHQGTLDWNFWRDGGIEFAFIRIGFRGYGTGAIVQDERFRENLAGAKAAGLQCGVYFYSQAITAEEAREEAAQALAWLEGTELELPVVFDWEVPASAEARTWELSWEDLRECAVAFCEEVQAGGYTPMLYANASTYFVYREEPRLENVDIWYAQYTDSEPYASEYSIWQYTQTGSVNGSLSIDLNLAYLNSEGRLLSAEELRGIREARVLS